ncbi:MULTISPECIES: hypothetical protein [Elizabethkingia]|uniref:hypothetical protein n=1 Tax=Elizabethkingia TaxID=308865 RepID=UPI0009BEAD22|nr:MULTISPECIES: hypothetical protein [Elizabethkingia]MCL1656154.1 hypothetical protein [Elizabethkingia miricola]MCP1253673.1 hypothetical protein [Elizabethkingia sp. S0634]MDX8571321.1 hypothetical protein [Elizabethkingia sp. HX QKY]
MDNELDNISNPEEFLPEKRIKKDYVSPKLNIIISLTQKPVIKCSSLPNNSTDTDSEREHNPLPEDSGV